jgi:phage major head subunit gpT-like protein
MKMKTTLIYSLLAIGSLALFGVTAHAADFEQVLALSTSLEQNPEWAMVAFVGNIVDKQKIANFFVGLKTIFHNSLKAEGGDWRKTAMEVPSTTKIEDYTWLNRLAKWRRWIGEKYVKMLSAGNYKIVNEDWEVTHELDRNDIEDDTSGHYATQVQINAEEANELYDIISDELKNGAFVNKCIDGQPYYDTDHPVGEGFYSNKLTAALSSATRAAADASIGAALTMMGKYKDSEGMSLRLKGNLLEVPPALLATATVLATAEKLDDGSNNPYRNKFEVLENPGIESDTQWMLHNTKKTIKPFIIQVRKKPTFVSSDENEFHKRKLEFGAEARAAGAYGFPQLSIGSTGQG